MSTRTALVTGAGRRMGRAIAEHLAAHGWTVALVAHGSYETAKTVAAQIAAEGGRAVALRADLRDRCALAGLMQEATRAVGPVTLLVNNASVFEKDEANSFDFANWDASLAVHLTAPAVLARDLARLLPEGVEGNVVNIADQRVLRPNPLFFSYTLGKMALWDLTVLMAQGLAPRVRVNAIGPGPTLRGARQSEADFAAQVEATPLHRGPSLDEIGRAVRFIVETPSLTGHLLTLDGGQHLAWATPDVVGIRE